MFKVTFTVSGHGLTFEQLGTLVGAASAKTEYEPEMKRMHEEQLILERKTYKGKNEEFIHETIWVDKKTNEDWTKRIHETPSLKKFYDNLEDLGLSYVIEKETIES